MRRKSKAPYLFVAPMALILYLLIYVPIAFTLVYSFLKMNLKKPRDTGFNGLNNYLALFRDPQILQATLNSLSIMVMILLMTLLLGLVFALILKRDTPIKNVLTAIAIIPWAIPPIVCGIVWRWIFHPSFGLLNSVLLLSHLIEEPVQWLQRQDYILAIVSISVAWRVIPLATVTFLAALQGIPEHLYEAAEIDGCTVFGKFTRVTLPLLRPSLGIVLTTTSITAINVFDEIVALIGYSTANNTLMMETYMRTFKFMKFGQGSALTYLIMLFAGIFGILYTRSVYKEVEYI